MIFLHTSGVSRVGDIHRYTVTYTPSQDVSPSPSTLYLRVKNTASLPLRAAYLHGPYTLYVSVRRQEFEPWPSNSPRHEEEDPVFVNEGCIPEFDPQLKAGSSFYATLPVPHLKSVTWIVEVVSQTIFSATASVGFDVMLGSDEKSLSSSAASAARPGSVGSADTSPSDLGIFTRALKVKTQGTRDLWNIPPFPSWDREGEDWWVRNGEYLDPEDQDEAGEKRSELKKRKTKRVHLVILTHGLHSNTGADMLFMKEAIDREARKGDIAWRESRRKEQDANCKKPGVEDEDVEDEDDREQVIVRGFHENVCRTERGIKYLGRRLARYVLCLVYPSTSPPLQSAPHKLHKDRPTHHRPHLAPLFSLDDNDGDIPPYKITSISFIGHSLGGLVQTYAIAYIHAHSPNFFTDIAPISFVTLATPFLGLSNENPLYVKFALDFGLVGRTGQDLGLTWRAPSAFSAFTTKPATAVQPPDPSKPLLRILPTGPAHEALKMFRNRTVYANVVNDGIVPLRTSCLLFLDWKGLGKVEKARRENSAVQGLVGWGWGQLTNGSTSPRGSLFSSATLKGVATESPASRPATPGFWSRKSETPAGGSSPLINASEEDGKDNPISEAPLTSEPTNRESQTSSQHSDPSAKTSSAPNAFTSLLTLFRPHASSKTKAPDSKSSKIYRRSQTIPLGDTSRTDTLPSFPQPSELDSLPSAPPRTTLLEAANHILNPPLPSMEFIIDPPSRPRTIFHDRIYSATDVPPLPSPPSPPDANGHTSPTKESMKVEEKIARAYHKDLAWRKVLVRLEPDAHNNMIVRRMFANAYGWPVVRHVVETHFGESFAAHTADEDEEREDRAALPEDIDDSDTTPRQQLGLDEATLDSMAPLDLEQELAAIKSRVRSPTTSSGAWSDRAFAITDDEDSDSSEDMQERKEEEIGRFLGLQPRLQKPAGGEIHHKSKSTIAGAKVDIVVSPGSSGSGSGDLGDGPTGVWGEGGLGLVDITRVGLGRWGSAMGASKGRPAGASLEAVRPGSDAVRLLERNISIAGPSRSRGRERGANSGSKSGCGDDSDLGDRSMLELSSGAGAVN